MNIATDITDRQVAAQAPSCDPIGWALFYKMDWCERHPGVMFLAIGGLILLEAVFEQVMP